MTREEAIRQLQLNKEDYTFIIEPEALDMALASLKTDEAYQLEYENRDFVEIPKGMTNGEVIQALFPKAKIFENESNIEYPYVDVFLYSENDMDCFKKEWWNAPYQKGGE